MVGEVSHYIHRFSLIIAVNVMIDARVNGYLSVIVVSIISLDSEPLGLPVKRRRCKQGTPGYGCMEVYRSILSVVCPLSIQRMDIYLYSIDPLSKSFQLVDNQMSTLVSGNDTIPVHKEVILICQQLTFLCTLT